MKKYFISFATFFLTSIAFLFLFCQPAMAYTSYQTGFDSYNTGLINYQDGWSLSSGIVNIQTSTTYGGSSKAVEVVRQSYVASSAERWFVGQIDNISWFSAYIMPGSSSWEIHIGDTGSIIAAKLRYSEGNLQIMNGNGSGGGTWTTVQTVSTSTWYRIELKMDKSTDKTDLYVDKILKNTNIGFINGTVSVVRWLKLYTAPGTSGTNLFVDDIKIRGDSFYESDMEFMGTGLISAGAQSGLNEGWQMNTGTVNISSVPAKWKLSGYEKAIEVPIPASGQQNIADLNHNPGTGVLWVDMFIKPSNSGFTIYNGKDAANSASLVSYTSGYLVALNGNGSGGGAYVNVCAVNTNEWYRVVLKLDTSSKNYDIYVYDFPADNDGPDGNPDGIPDREPVQYSYAGLGFRHNTTTSIGFMRLLTNYASGAPSLFIDDIKITDITPGYLWKKFYTKDASNVNYTQHVRFGNLNADSTVDMVMSRMKSNADNRVTEIGSITAVDVDGTILWQVGTPATNPVENGPNPLQVYDIDNDGQDEVICVYGGKIQIRNGSNGAVEREITAPDPGTPYPKLIDIVLADFTGNGFKGDILIKDEYWTVYAYDNQLNLLWSDSWSALHDGTGHFPRPFDCDDDGRDEIIVGDTLIDHNGIRLWERFAYTSEHADSIKIDDLDGIQINGMEIVIAHSGNSGSGDYGMIVYDIYGNKLWSKTDIGHAQNCEVGNFRDDSSGLEVFGSNSSPQNGETMMNVYVYDSNGNSTLYPPMDGYLNVTNVDIEHIENWFEYQVEDLLLIPSTSGLYSGLGIIEHRLKPWFQGTPTAWGIDFAGQTDEGEEIVFIGGSSIEIYRNIER